MQDRILYLLLKKKTEDGALSREEEVSFVFSSEPQLLENQDAYAFAITQ